MSRANKEASFIGLTFQNSILLAKRSECWRGLKVPFGGYWSFFGGTIEDGETPPICAQRELWEESQIYRSLEGIKFFDIIKNSECNLHIHFAEINTLISPILNEEHSQYGWFSMDVITHFQGKIDEAIVEVIQRYSDSLSS